MAAVRVLLGVILLSLLLARPISGTRARQISLDPLTSATPWEGGIYP